MHMNTREYEPARPSEGVNEPRRSRAELESANRDLVAEVARLRAIFENEPECVKLLAEDGSVLEMNPAGLRIVEAESLAQVQHRCIYPLVAEAYRPAFVELTARAFRGETGVLEFELTGLKGGHRWLETYTTPLRDLSGQVVALLGITRDVTERKRAEAALRESEERLRPAVQASNVGLWDWDLETNQVRFSREWKRQLGYEEHEIGNDYREWEQRLHPEDKGPTLKRLERTLAGHCPVYDVEFRLRHKDDSYRWIYARGEVYRDSSGRPRRMMGCHVDITDRKNAEAAVRAADQQRAELIASIDGIVWEADAETFRFSFVSAQAERILGHPIRRWIDEPAFWVEHLHPEDRDLAVSFCAACTREKRDHNFEYRMRAADGRYVWLHDLVTVVVEGGRPAKLRGIMVDITARKQAEEERRRLEAQLQHTQKLESLGILAGGIAHDFNNLLTGILGYADLALLELPPNSPARPHIVEAVNGARRAAELTRQMLAYSGKGRFVVEPLDLSGVVREMAPLLQISVSKRCRLAYGLTPGLPLVEADATQMRPVIMNLVINASEAIGERDGEIRVATGARHCDRDFLAERTSMRTCPRACTSSWRWGTTAAGCRRRRGRGSSTRSSRPSSRGAAWGCRRCWASSGGTGGRSSARACRAGGRPSASCSRRRAARSRRRSGGPDRAPTGAAAARSWSRMTRPECADLPVACSRPWASPS
jgi:PAS domain S-box-containing protein